ECPHGKKRVHDCTCWDTVVHMRRLRGHHMLPVGAQGLPAVSQRSVRYGNPPAFMNDTRPAL
ncbi:hypothetical protein DVA76_18535, partial [Acinetobacter baumannii]